MKRWCKNLLWLVPIAITGILLKPTQYNICLPGGTLDVGRVIEIADSDDFEDKGSMNLVYVTEYKAAIVDVIYAQLDPYASLEKVDRSKEPTIKEEIRHNKETLTTSKTNARAEAVEACNTYNKSSNSLQNDDTLFSPQDAAKIKFKLRHNLGGPSAGLMFTLQIYEKLNHVDLTKGRNICGTGTIEHGGVVGPIGGISKKIIAAHRSGATVFLAPNNVRWTEMMQKYYPGMKTNYEEAKEAAEKAGITDMEIVPVETVKEAIDYLQKSA
jgi:PDZ domain-containing secreted protein